MYVTIGCGPEGGICTGCHFNETIVIIGIPRYISVMLLAEELLL